MFGSKINELSESTFRENRNQHSSRLKQRGTSAVSIDFEAEGEPLIHNNRKKLQQYLIDLPTCSYHHLPIKYLCLSPTCQSSNYAVCEDPSCRKLHSNPDSELIQLDSFNQVVSTNCSTLLLLNERLRKYFTTVHQQFLQKLDKEIEKAQYIIQNIYVGEVPRLIRQKRNRQLTSAKLYHFVKKETVENNPRQRVKMETLRNQVATRISQFEINMAKVLESKHFQKLILSDIIKGTELSTSFDLMGRLEIRQFESSILQYKQDFQIVCRMLKENRAPQFSKITTIFRASQSSFSARSFHNAVDGKNSTVTIIKTSLGKRFGAFVNCKFDKCQQWIADATGLSFIFSIDRVQVYKLKPQAGSRLKAIFGGLQGPQVGSGCDLYLVDQCNKFRANGANLGGSYRLPPHLQFNTSQARSYLAGEEFFLVEEYETFILQ